MPTITSVRLKVGMEIHVELATRSKMFTRVASPAHPEHFDAEPNTLIDPLVLALPGALPVLNEKAIELSVRVGLALGCEIAGVTKWDRKSYSYPDLPKAYQLSQYDMPLCGAGVVEWPIGEGGEARRVRITRAHLEEDAGKLLHEWPGGRAIDCSIVDLNRAGTPLLEIVTEPDFDSGASCVAFAQMLRDVCRFVGATVGDMQKGHMRFEPNINTVLTLDDGRTVATPVVEIKNLNSFRSLGAAIAYELEHQPRRWMEDGIEMGPGAKRTRGWDDEKMVSFLQREKEDAHDYRYFPDPDLLPLCVDGAWVESLRAEIGELPHERIARYRAAYGLGEKEASALVREPSENRFFEAALDEAGAREDAALGRLVANVVLQHMRRVANEEGLTIDALGVSAAQVAGIARLRVDDSISSGGADALVEALRGSDEDPPAAAERLGLLQVRDAGQLGAWVEAVIGDDAHAKAVADVRAGKMAAAGRLIGAVMALSGGAADAKQVRAMILEKLGGG